MSKSKNPSMLPAIPRYKPVATESLKGITSTEPEMKFSVCNKHIICYHSVPRTERVSSVYLDFWRVLGVHTNSEW